VGEAMGGGPGIAMSRALIREHKRQDYVLSVPHQSLSSMHISERTMLGAIVRNTYERTLRGHEIPSSLAPDHILYSEKKNRAHKDVTFLLLEYPTAPRC
jgi:hypothetical protein